MCFNPDPAKQAQEVIFSRKLHKVNNPNVYFNQCAVQNTNAQKHLGVVLDSNSLFNLHMKEKISKANKGIWCHKKTSEICSTTLITDNL